MGASPFPDYPRTAVSHTHRPTRLPTPVSSADSKPRELRQYLRFCLQRRYHLREAVLPARKRRILTFHVPRIVTEPLARAPFASPLRMPRKESIDFLGMHPEGWECLRRSSGNVNLWRNVNLRLEIRTSVGDGRGRANGIDEAVEFAEISAGKNCPVNICLEPRSDSARLSSISPGEILG